MGVFLSKMQAQDELEHSAHKDGVNPTIHKRMLEANTKRSRAEYDECMKLYSADTVVPGSADAIRLRDRMIVLVTNDVAGIDIHAQAMSRFRQSAPC